MTTPPTLEQIATPRTDKRRAELRGKTIVAQFALLEEHARQLERELATLQTATKQPQGADLRNIADEDARLYDGKATIPTDPLRRCLLFMRNREAVSRKQGFTAQADDLLAQREAILQSAAPLVANREDSERLEAKWVVPHPGTLEWIDVPSFEEAMEKWFEGFNVPCLVTNGKKEDSSVSHARVKKYFNDRAAMRSAQPERGQGEGTP